MEDGAPLDPLLADTLLQPLRRFRCLVVAVSGGGDSTALLYLMHRWRTGLGAAAPVIEVATVDHGLRPASAGEADAVARLSRRWGFAHQTLRWTGPHPASGLQQAAREARYDLLHAAAIRLGPDAAPDAVAIVTAHTADDQAETLLMRLARGSGVDGLAGIPGEGRVVRLGPDARWRAVPVLRPLLGVARASLVATLAAAGIEHAEDASNRDPRFERVRVREALHVLAPLGVTRAALARTAARLHRARLALDAGVDALEAHAVTTVAGLVYDIDAAAFASAPAEIGVRLLRRLLPRAGGSAPAAGLAAIEVAQARLAAASGVRMPGFTLGGCMLEAGGAGEETRGARICLYREPDRDGGVPTLRLAAGGQALWDRRCRVVAAVDAPVAEVGPIGREWPNLAARHPVLAGLALPSAALRGLPAIRIAGAVAAVPLLSAVALARGDVAGARWLEGPRRGGRSIAGPAGVPLFELRPVDWRAES